MYSVPVVGFLSTLIYIRRESFNAMRESPDVAQRHFKPEQGNFRRSIVSSQDINILKERGIVIIDNVLSKDELMNARDEINHILNTSSKFESNGHSDILTRRDDVFWISESIGHHQLPTKLTAGIMLALRCVRSIPHDLVVLGGYNSSNLGVPFSNQLACYDGDGAHYSPHRDSPETDSKVFTHPLSQLLDTALYDREITIILYLNESIWDSTIGNVSDSGHLRCYLDAKPNDMTGVTAKDIIDIVPIGGRMVIFNSKKVLHEVRPSCQRRIAITCWVGGSHSKSEWLRPFSIPYDEINWKSLLNNW